MRAAFFDVDGTLLRGSIPRTFLWAGLKQGVFSRREVARSVGLGSAASCLPATAKGSLLFWGLRRLMRGHTTAEMDLVAEASLPYILKNLKRSTLACLQWHKAEGYRVTLISGGLENVLIRLAQELGVHAEGTRLEVREQTYTGHAGSPICRGYAKAERLRDLAGELGIDLVSSIGFGDSTDDIPFLKLTGRAVVVDPSMRLRIEALRQGWPVLDGRSTGGLARVLA